MEDQPGGLTSEEAQESEGASGGKEAGVNEQLDPNDGDLITLSLEEKGVTEVETEQQVNSSQVWSELDFTDILPGALGVEKGDIIKMGMGKKNMRAKWEGKVFWGV
ncbi:hypothetical protein ABG768_016069 [Culter alburnus]|uniref:Uncharacterized protein n=1 Tax=Culter alburnus TaxID=194366 RepID=A0AAW1YXV2_CULAL